MVTEGELAHGLDQDDGDVGQSEGHAEDEALPAMGLPTRPDQQPWLPLLYRLPQLLPSARHSSVVPDYSFGLAHMASSQLHPQSLQRWTVVGFLFPLPRLLLVVHTLSSSLSHRASWREARLASSSHFFAW